MYLFIDTETTGIPQNWKAPISDLDNWPRLVQIAWLLFDKEKNLIDEKNYIIRPEEFSIPFNAIQIHNITTEIALAMGNDLSRVLKELSSTIDKSEFIIAHNLNFDEKIIGAEFLRKKIDNNLSKKKRICTMEETTNFCALPGNYGYKWPKLSELHFKLFRTSYNEIHNASADIKATAKCFWALYDRGFFVNISPNRENLMKPNAIENTIISQSANSTSFGTKQKPDLGIYHPTFAGFWKRFCAFWIDYSLLFLVNSIISIITDYPIPSDAKGPFYLFDYAFFIIIYPPGIFIAWLYYSIMECSKFQGTLGKLALKIKVTDINGLRVNFGRATGRFFGRFFSGLFFGIGFIMIAYTVRKQALHDQMANCCVLRKYNNVE